MPTDSTDVRLARRVAALFSSDEQFAAAAPDRVVSAALARPGLRLPEMVRTVMNGYSERLALAQRASRQVRDVKTGRVTLELLPYFDAITYAETWERVQALANAWHSDPVGPGDRVAILGFNSTDYAIVDTSLTQLGAVSVPLQTSAPIAELLPIVAETEPVVIAASIDRLSDAVGLALTCPAAERVVVFDYYPAVDDQRDAFDAATNRLADANSFVHVETLTEVLARGAAMAPVPPVIPDGEDPLYLLIYTSGSTGTPKGAMYPESRLLRFWGVEAMSDWGGQSTPTPSITLNFMPMSHVLGRAILLGTLNAGGTAYFTPRSDLSTLLEDLALVRPTQLSFVPRIWEILFQEYQSRVDRGIAEGADRATVENKVIDDIRHQLLGGRVVAALTGSAPISPDLLAWVEGLLDMHVAEGYGSTESGVMFIDGRVIRPPVIDYKLADVPELGYFHTDRPHPRGELLVKCESMFPGYYKRPDINAATFTEDGYYRTGDIFAETGTDHLQYLDRRNFVLKLSQGEFVTVSRLEAAFNTSPLIGQIYVYGNSIRSHLLAVIVPTEDTLATHEGVALKAILRDALHGSARAAGLRSYEIPRDFIVERTPFTLENGLLTGIRKLARPKLKEHYGARLEQLYTDLAEGRANELRTLRDGGRGRPVLETIARVAAVLLGIEGSQPDGGAHFTELGGDSLSALTFANLLQEIFDFDIPVGVIVSPANDLRAVADYIEAERLATNRPTPASVHGRDATEVRARDLTLDKFIDVRTLTGASSLPDRSSDVRTVLLTGATGFLGRRLALQWLERMNVVDGTVICLVRARDAAAARERLDQTFDSGDPELLSHYRQLTEGHLEVIAGDMGELNLGLDPQTWQRLADTVDVIIDSAALVNHVLPYGQLFGPNVVGTTELIRLALTTKKKPFIYVSTIGVGAGIDRCTFSEDADIRTISATRSVDDSYANGYANSKWAGEVLLREAHDLCDLPVAVFRCDMILTDATYAGQLNVPDMFTRMILSVVTTGIAPRSFYELDAEGNRQPAHYDGLPVDFIAEAITTLGAGAFDGFDTYHVVNPYDDGLGLDEYVDWLIDAGYAIHRVSDYATWLQRFETAIRALPERQRRVSLLPLIHNYHSPQIPVRGSMAPTNRFRAAVESLNVRPGEGIPHVTPAIIVKYVTDLELRGLL